MIDNKTILVLDSSAIFDLQHDRQRDELEIDASITHPAPHLDSLSM